MADLALPPPTEGTKEVAARVARARAIQAEQLKDRAEGQRPVNADMTTQEIETFCVLDSDSRQLISDAANRFSLSARAYHRVLKLARTIADLDDAKQIARFHLAEALTYRWREPAAETLQFAPS